MTNVDILYRYATQPAEAVLFALGEARDVYGIRKLNFDGEAKTVLVEYDATRLNAGMITGLLRRAGLDIVEELALIPPPAPTPAAAAEPAKA